MKYEIDSDKIVSWTKTHLAWVLPVGLFALSWVGAKNAGSNPSGVEVWWVWFSVLTGIGAVGLSVHLFTVLFDLK